MIDSADCGTAWGQRLSQGGSIAHVARDHILRTRVNDYRSLLWTVNERPDSLSPGTESPDGGPARLACSTGDQNHACLNTAPGLFMDLFQSNPIIQNDPGMPTLLPQS
jgi:hypothetical protein